MSTYVTQRLNEALRLVTESIDQVEHDLEAAPTWELVRRLGALQVVAGAIEAALPPVERDPPSVLLDLLNLEENR